MFGGVRKTSVYPIGIVAGDHTVRMMRLARVGDKRVAVASAWRGLMVQAGVDAGLSRFYIPDGREGGR